jgi:hypothetical protein
LAGAYTDVFFEKTAKTKGIRIPAGFYLQKILLLRTQTVAKFKR